MRLVWANNLIINSCGLQLCVIHCDERERCVRTFACEECFMYGMRVRHIHFLRQWMMYNHFTPLLLLFQLVTDKWNWISDSQLKPLGLEGWVGWSCLWVIIQDRMHKEVKLLHKVILLSDKLNHCWTFQHIYSLTSTLCGISNIPTGYLYWDKYIL